MKAESETKIETDLKIASKPWIHVEAASTAKRTRLAASFIYPRANFNFYKRQFQLANLRPCDTVLRTVFDGFIH
jgi:hypothetical protein